MSLPPLKPDYPFIKLRGAHLNLGAVLALTLATLGTGCSDTQAVQLGQCGNHVVEEGEDCDGQSGCNAECHLTCNLSRDSRDAQPCPAGWGCDVDSKICRTSDGSFTPVPLELPALSRLYSADFDGDGRSDLLGVEPITEELSHLLFFDGQGATARQVSLPVAFSAAIADVTGDGLPDPFLGANEVNAFSAARSRNLWPLISSVRSVDPTSHLLAADVDCDGLRDFVLFEGSQLSQVPSNGELVPLAKLAYTVEDLSAGVVASEDDVTLLRRVTPVGRFNRQMGQACEFLAIPDPSLEHVDIYGPRDGMAGSFERLSSVRSSNTGFDRVLLVDVNDDGHDDLLLTGFDGNRVSYGLGDGTFHSNGSQIPAAFSGKGDNQTSVYDAYPGRILAAGSLPAQQPLLLDADAGYVDARVASLTPDGQLDAVAINSTGRVDVLRGLPDGRLSPLPIPANNLHSIEDVGDFDGDGMSDVLLTAQSDLDQPPSTVSLLFSPVISGSSARQLAFPGPIRELTAGYVGDANGAFDTNADIGVLYRGSDGGSRLGFLLGGSDQLLRSRVSADKTDELVNLRTPALGHFDDPSQLQLAIVKYVLVPEQMRLDLFTVDAEGSKLVDQTQLDISPDVATLSINLEAIDQDGDGLDELYMNDGNELAVLRREGGRFQVEHSDHQPWVPLTREDANGDGRADLTTLAQSNKGSTRVRVLLGASPDGTPGDFHTFDVDLSLCGFIMDRAFIQADDDGERELAVICGASEEVGIEGDVASPSKLNDASLLLFDVDWQRDALSLKGSPQPTDQALSLVVGDFNGDGVEDFVTGVGRPQLWLGQVRR